MITPARSYRNKFNAVLDFGGTRHIKSLPSGIYILSIELANGDTRSHRFVKVK